MRREVLQKLDGRMGMGKLRDAKLQASALGPSRPVDAVTWLAITFEFRLRWIGFDLRS